MLEHVLALLKELQQLDSFNFGLFLVYWFIFTSWNGLEPKVMTRVIHAILNSVFGICESR